MMQVSSLCPGEFPTNISTLTIQYSNGSIAAAHTNIPLLSSDNGSILTTTDMVSLAADQEYIATVTFSSNLLGEFTSITSNFTFSE